MTLIKVNCFGTKCSLSVFILDLIDNCTNATVLTDAKDREDNKKTSIKGHLTALYILLLHER